MSTNLPKELFGIEASEIKKHTPVLHQVVVAQLAAARQGTHKTKTRAEVRGGGRKPFRQKGTGRARQGSTRAPHFTGGGIVHGPVPRDYSQRTPKKLKAFALRLALSDRANAGNISIVDNFGIKGDKPSTKTALKALNDITSAKSVLVVVSRPVDNKTLEAELLSLRNISKVHLIYVDQINTYDVLLNEAIVFTQSAFDELVSDKVKKESK
ncbi:MAG: 50S ribosomal protein L4 [Candidatus Ancillula sp.]|jgi:large subunit ribosomal protein L4|nr:50S ribosomal protein L4 [Candidatus Ancillula sp.]